MKKQGWLPLMSGSSAVICAPDLLLLLMQFAAAVWSLGNCFSKPNATTIFYLSVQISIHCFFPPPYLLEWSLPSESYKHAFSI